MKYLKLFESHISEAEIARICKEFGILNWTINSNGLIDVNGNVYLANKELTSLPLKFGRVKTENAGSFNCRENKLTSLEGCPSYVGEDFDCIDNKLTSLEGCPSYVEYDFYCSHNNIKSFEGIGYIGVLFGCYGNPIYWLWALFRDVSKIEMFNEWGIIQGDNVILYRLNDFLETIGKGEVTEKQLKGIKNYYNVI